MKKLTAGIFSVLVGLVASNAADAAVASKGYVDKVAAVNTAAISALSETVTANKTAAENALNTYSETTNKAISDMDTAYKAADQGLQSQIDTKQVALKVATDSPLKLDDQGNLSLEGIASDTELANLTQTVEGHTTTLTTLTGDANVDGSIAKQIANAISAEETRANGLYATQANLTALQDVVNHAETGLAATKAIADQNKTDIGTINTTIGTLASKTELQANAEADATLAGRVTTAEGKISTAEGKIAILEASVGAEGTTTKAIEAAQSAADAAQSAAETAQSTADGAVAVNNEQATAITNLQSADTAINTKIGTVAEGKTVVGLIGEAQTAAEGYTDSAITALNLQDIARVPAMCSNENYYCALTTNGKKFVWEVIERDPETELATGSLAEGQGTGRLVALTVTE